MTFDEARARFASFMASGDTNEPMIATADRDRMIHEAYFEYYAAFTAFFKYTVDYPFTGNAFNVGQAGERQWIECEQAEVKIGAAYMPLQRGTFGQMMFLAASEGATGTPDQYGMTLVQRNLLTGLSQFRVAVYPRPVGSTNYRFRVKTYPPELAAGSDVLQLEKLPSDYVCRIASARAGLITGYSEEWAAEVMLPLPDEVKTELLLDKELRWPQTDDPRQIGKELVNGV